MGRHSILMLLLSQAKPRPPSIVTQEVVAISWMAAPLMEDIVWMTRANHWGRMTPALVVRTLTLG